mmetsp:Transcript_13772/g.37292  ORF Transcript_13772/g.37292 Transcript_13772/m.37292 type:complete len:161 (-) Transcript_13772:85-567(-)
MSAGAGGFGLCRSGALDDVAAPWLRDLDRHASKLEALFSSRTGLQSFAEESASRGRYLDLAADGASTGTGPKGRAAFGRIGGSLQALAGQLDAELQECGRFEASLVVDAIGKELPGLVASWMPRDLATPTVDATAGACSTATSTGRDIARPALNSFKAAV